VNVHLGEGEKMPSVDEFTDTLRQQFSDFHVSLDQEEGDKQVTLVRITLAPKLADGGLGAYGPAMSAACRAGLVPLCHASRRQRRGDAPGHRALPGHPCAGGSALIRRAG
jgi:hypothetical protein